VKNHGAAHYQGRQDGILNLGGCIKGMELRRASSQRAFTCVRNARDGLGGTALHKPPSDPRQRAFPLLPGPDLESSIGEYQSVLTIVHRGVDVEHPKGISLFFPLSLSLYTSPSVLSIDCQVPRPSYQYGSKSQFHPPLPLLPSHPTFPRSVLLLLQRHTNNIHRPFIRQNIRIHLLHHRLLQPR
jgi:hypothetical protein